MFHYLEATIVHKDGRREWLNPVLRIDIDNGYHTWPVDLASVERIELVEKEGT